MSERKNRTYPLVLPARRRGAAAGIAPMAILARFVLYPLVTVGADYSEPRPSWRLLPRGRWVLLTEISHSEYH